MRVDAGTVHALLGENGAGKSTLVKCIMGFYRADQGSLLLNGAEAEVRNPRDASRLGLGMVYQHFTLVPSMTVLENLVMARADTPSVIDWGSERKRLSEFIATMPFTVPLDTPVHGLAAGEKQKAEILKQLYLGARFLILDEPTSVLTPQEADRDAGDGARHGAREAADRADDHPQVPRSARLRRRGDGAAQGTPGGHRQGRRSHRRSAWRR